MEIFATDEFKKRYRKLPIKTKKKAEKQVEIFKENSLHPLLNLEKLEPKNKQAWSIRVDKKYRIIFRFLDNNDVLLLTVGPHDWIYKIKF
jgi:mRNA-degrading endonuclease RelE of RelBE toxin-antitoxin system